MAPELLAPGTFGLADSRPTQPADIYAMGMVIYEVLTGFYPFYDLNLGPFEIVLRVSAGKRPTKPGNSEGIGFGSGTWELVQECWKAQSARRPTVERVVQHLEHVSASSASVPPTGAQHPGTPHISIQLSAFGNLSFQTQKLFSGSGGASLLVILDSQIFSCLPHSSTTRRIEILPQHLGERMPPQLSIPLTE